MNPQIRYPDPSQNAHSIKFSYDEMRTIDRKNPPSRHDDSSKYFEQMTKQQIASSQPLLVKHKSSNADTKFYQETNFTQSYRLEPQPFPAFNNQDNTSYKSNNSINQDSNPTYKSTNYVNNREETHKFQTANDFFTIAAESVKNTDNFRKQLRNTQHIVRQQQTLISSNPFFQQTHKNQPFQQIKPQPFQQIKPQQFQQIKPQQFQQIKPQQFQQIKPQQFEPASDECQKCEQLQKQNQRIIAFMRQQLEIGVKQFTDRMNKIILEQTKQIKDLRKSLINNQKMLINFNKHSSQNIQYFKGQKSTSPGRGVVKQRSPSKLSLTKSNTSISTHHVSKQKITMVSRELSPSKTSIHHNSKKPQKKHISYQQKLSSTIHVSNQSSLTSEEIQRKIKVLEDHIQVLGKLEHERNEKAFFMNKKIQTLEKGIVSYFGSKTLKLKSVLSQWMFRQQDKLKQLYNQMKVISSRVGSMSNNSQNPPLKQINSTNLKNTQNSCHSTPSILLPPNQKEQSAQMNMNKMSIKLKHFSSEIDDLKQIATNLQTKEYKYDNFQIQSLKKLINQVHSQMRKIQKAKKEINGKLLENEERLEKVIQMSKFSQMGSHTDIYPSSSHENQFVYDNQMKKMSKVNIMRNNSVDISYSHKNYMNETGYKMNDGTKSMKSEIPLKSEVLVNEVQILPKFMNIMGTKNHSNFEDYSHSQFKGFGGEQSGFSQYVQESVYNNEGGYNNNNDLGQYKQEKYENEEQSFERSSQEDNDQDQQEEEEEDEFFYRVDLSTHDKLSQNGRSEGSQNRLPNNLVPSSTINRFMQVIEYRQNKPLRIEIDQTGYIKSADNGMYIVDRNMDGFDLNRNQLQWLRNNGVIILEK